MFLYLCLKAPSNNNNNRPPPPYPLHYQSLMCITASVVVPLTANGKSPPLTNAAARMPPSKSAYLPPLRGQLEDPDSASLMHPP